MDTNNNFPTPHGVDKHRAIAYIYMNEIDKVGVSHERRFYAYVRASYTGMVDVRDNTNAASPIDQGQVMREECPTFEIETTLPYNEDQAKDYINYLRAGRIINTFDIINRDGSGVFEKDYLAYYGTYIIEKATIDISRDDFTTLRATITALGYNTNAESRQQLNPVVMPL